MALDIIESSKIKSPWSTRRSVWVAVISLILGIVVFGLAYIGMLQNIGIGVFNQPILAWMVGHRDPQITNIMKLITEAASPIIFTVVVCVGAGFWALIKREIWRPLLLIGSTGAAAILSTALKTVTTNGRPPVVNMIAPFEIDYSFPSGHTISIAVCLLVLGYLIYSRRSSGIRIFTWTIITTFGIGMIAISRLYLGYHWLTDIVSSIGLGFAILAGVIIIDIIVDRRFKN